MKIIIYILVSLIFLFSCTETDNVDNMQSTAEKIEPKQTISESEQLRIRKTENDILSHWTNYYMSLDSSFSLNNFFLERTDTVMFIQGNVLGIFDKEFNSIYRDFIVFSPNNKCYIDIDSYQWTTDDNNSPIFSPDQEINLIDIDNRTVTRIGFNGPLQWTENAYWMNDTTIILLENSSEKILRISELDISNRIEKTYKYLDTLSLNSNYSELRLEKKGINTSRNKR